MGLTESFYQYFLKIKDYLCYKFSRKRNKLDIILTFDDKVDETSIRIARFLYGENIKATFFIPPAKTEDRFIRKIASLGHEIGGHGYDHSKEEAKENYDRSAAKCYRYLKKFYPSLISWRFPGLRTTKKGFANVRRAGFKIDSSKGVYYPIQNPKKFRGMLEYPFLRLSPRSQMDAGIESYESLKRRILKTISSQKGIVILPFHTNYQNEHFKEFKGLIKELKERKINFKQLRDVGSKTCYKKLSVIGSFTFTHR